MSEEVQYFALPKEVVQQVLAHLAKDPVAGLYEKVSQALLVNKNEEKATETSAPQNNG